MSRLGTWTEERFESWYCTELVTECPYCSEQIEGLTGGLTEFLKLIIDHEDNECEAIERLVPIGDPEQK